MTQTHWLTNQKGENEPRLQLWKGMIMFISFYRSFSNSLMMGPQSDSGSSSSTLPRNVFSSRDQQYGQISVSNNFPGQSDTLPGRYRITKKNTEKARVKTRTLHYKGRPKLIFKNSFSI